MPSTIKNNIKYPNLQSSATRTVLFRKYRETGFLWVRLLYTPICEWNFKGVGRKNRGIKSAHPHPWKYNLQSKRWTYCRHGVKLDTMISTQSFFRFHEIWSFVSLGFDQKLSTVCYVWVISCWTILWHLSLWFTFWFNVVYNIYDLMNFLT